MPPVWPRGHGAGLGGRGTAMRHGRADHGRIGVTAGTRRGGRVTVVRGRMPMTRQRNLYHVLGVNNLHTLNYIIEL